MRTLSKYAAAATLAGALALAAATPSQARWHGTWHTAPRRSALAPARWSARPRPARPISGYYGYDYYGPDYAYAPGRYESYAYEPAPAMSAAVPRQLCAGVRDRPGGRIARSAAGDRQLRSCD